MACRACLRKRAHLPDLPREQVNRLSANPGTSKVQRVQRRPLLTTSPGRAGGPAGTRLHHDPAAVNGNVGRRPPVMPVHPGGLLDAARAGRRLVQRTWDWWLALGDAGRAEMAAKSLDLPVADRRPG
jgi:hypothetical protein